MPSFASWARMATQAFLFALFTLLPMVAQGQEDTLKPIPILTGSTAYFTRVTGGEFQHTPTVSPLLLAPLGDKWLIEAKGNYSVSYAKGDEGYYESTSSYGLLYG